MSQIGPEDAVSNLSKWVDLVATAPNWIKLPQLDTIWTIAFGLMALLSLVAAALPERFLSTRKPRTGPAFNESKIKDSILAEEQFSIGFHQSGFAQIHRAVDHVAKRIGDTDAENCFPSTLVVLRQKAVDGALRMRGRKQLDVDEMRFSRVHTDIPKEYWATTTIGALATDAKTVEDTHTNPETAYAWGPKGVYERNRYADLQVEWSDILKLWPK